MKAIFILSTLLMTLPSWAVITVYHDRPDDKVYHMTQAFTLETGISVKIEPKMSAKDIETKLTNEGQKSPADVVIVKDVVYLTNLTNANVLQKLNSPAVKELVRPSMYSPYWTALTYRARTLVYDKSVDVSEINTYEDLADNKYEGQLCLRTSKSSYNQGLGATLIQAYGVEKASEIFDGWLANLSWTTDIFKSDSNIIRSLVGIDGFKKNCDLGVVNSYYLGLLLKKYPDLNVGIKYLTLPDGGVSTNGIGAAIAKASKNPKQARMFIEFMLSEKMQQYFTGENQDFPANQNVDFDKNIKMWQGQFEPSTIHWEEMGQLATDASDMFFELDYQ